MELSEDVWRTVIETSSPASWGKMSVTGTRLGRLVRTQMAQAAVRVWEATLGQALPYVKLAYGSECPCECLKRMMAALCKNCRKSVAHCGGVQACCQSALPSMGYVTTCFVRKEARLTLKEVSHVHRFPYGPSFLFPAKEIFDIALLKHGGTPQRVWANDA